MAKSKNKQEEVKMEQQEETKAVATKEPNAAVQATDAAAWGANMGISAQDLIIPRILLMQPMSEKVTAGEAKFGEFRESLNWEELGSIEKPFEVLPFHLEKVFVEFDVTDPKEKKFLRVVPITPANEDLPYEDQERGESGQMIPISRDRTLNIYVLLPHELEMGSAIPHILSARRTSLQAGKKIATQFAKNAQVGKSPAAIIMEVSARKQTEEKKTWAVMDVKPKRPTPDKYVVEAYKWMQMIVSGKAKVDTASYETEARSESRNVESSGESVETGPVRF